MKILKEHIYYIKKFEYKINFISKTYQYFKPLIKLSKKIIYKIKIN